MRSSSTFLRVGVLCMVSSIIRLCEAFACDDGLILDADAGSRLNFSIQTDSRCNTAYFEDAQSNTEEFSPYDGSKCAGKDIKNGSQALSFLLASNTSLGMGRIVLLCEEQEVRCTSVNVSRPMTGWSNTSTPSDMSVVCEDGAANLGAGPSLNTPSQSSLGVTPSFQAQGSSTVYPSDGSSVGASSMSMTTPSPSDLQSSANLIGDPGTSERGPTNPTADPASDPYGSRLPDQTFSNNYPAEQTGNAQESAANGNSGTNDTSTINPATTGLLSSMTSGMATSPRTNPSQLTNSQQCTCASGK